MDHLGQVKIGGGTYHLTTRFLSGEIDYWSLFLIEGYWQAPQPETRWSAMLPYPTDFEFSRNPAEALTPRARLEGQVVKLNETLRGIAAALPAPEPGADNPRMSWLEEMGELIKRLIFFSGPDGVPQVKIGE